MKRRLALGAALAGALVAGGAASAQHGGHGPSASGSEGHLAAQRCAEEFTKVVGEGRGFGMAFAADRNGYPGPMHVLELRDVLRLTAEQEAKARELHEAVRSEVPKSARLLEAERRLERLFAQGLATKANVRAAVAEIERARSEVRLVHLLAHLRTHDVLTDAQRRAYHQARWGGR